MKKLLLVPLAMALVGWLTADADCSTPRGNGSGHSSASGRSKQASGRSQVNHPTAQRQHSVPRPGTKSQARHPRLPHYPKKWGKPTVKRCRPASSHVRRTPGWGHTARCFGWRNQPATWHHRCGNHHLIARGYTGWTHSCLFPRYNCRFRYCGTTRDWYFYSRHCGCYVPCRVLVGLYGCEGQGEPYGDDSDAEDDSDGDEEGGSFPPSVLDRALEQMLRGG